MDRNTPFEERLQKHLFSNSDELKEVFSVTEFPRVLRLREIYHYIMENPLMPDRMYVDYLMSVHNLGRRMAQNDVATVRPFLSNVKLISKQFLRSSATQEVLEMMAQAKEMGNIDAWTKLMGQLIKINGLDKDDKEPLPFEMIVPLSAEPTGDVSIIKGKKAIPNRENLAARLRAMYGKIDNLDAIESVDFDEINEKVKANAKELEANGKE